MKKVLLYLLIFILLLSNILFLYQLAGLHFLNVIYYSIIFIISLLLFLLVCFVLFRKKTNRVWRFIFILIGCILVCFYSIGIFTIYNTKSYIIDAVHHDEKEYKTYYVFVLKKSDFDTIQSLKGHNVGFLKEDGIDTLSVSTLKEKIGYQEKIYDDIGSMIESFSKKEIDAISIDSSYWYTLRDDKLDIVKRVKKVYSYRVEMKDNNDVVVAEKMSSLNPFILYISGSDSRTGIRTRARSDTNIIAVVNPSEYKILLVSIPRDYYVRLHGTSGLRDKLTHAGVYGVNMSINTIEDLLDIHIDRYLKVSFSTVINGVDVLDGIDIDSDISFIPHTNKSCIFHQGVQHVDGTCALAFSRERKAYLEGDRHRGENQEQVIAKMIEKMSRAQYLIRYNDVLNATRGSFDTNMSYDEISELIKYELKTLSKWDVQTYNLNGTGASAPTYSMGAQLLYVMEPDYSTVEMAKVKINEYLKNR